MIPKEQWAQRGHRLTSLSVTDQLKTQDTFNILTSYGQRVLKIKLIGIRNLKTHKYVWPVSSWSLRQSNQTLQESDWSSEVWSAVSVAQFQLRTLLRSLPGGRQQWPVSFFLHKMWKFFSFVGHLISNLKTKIQECKLKEY